MALHAKSSDQKAGGPRRLTGYDLPTVCHANPSTTQGSRPIGKRFDIDCFGEFSSSRSASKKFARPIRSLAHGRASAAAGQRPAYRPESRDAATAGSRLACPPTGVTA